MAQIIDLNFRASEYILDRVLNPNHDPDIGNARPVDLVEACGIIPDFFCTACCEAQQNRPAWNEGKTTLLDIANKMDDAYGCGGFAQYLSGHNNSLSGVDARGVYSYPDDPDLHPLARFGFADRFLLYVYDYGMCAIVDTAPDPDNTAPVQYIARFD